MAIEDEVRDIVVTTLQLGDKGKMLDASSHLLGAIPEFDSMAVVAVLNALEESYGFTVDDDEIEASTFETFGSLCEFVERKLEA